MCGIVGVATATGGMTTLDSAGNRQQALASLHHRGPDAQGQYEDSGIWLAHTRLSILDLSALGNQPMKSANERFVISYNGEVYNFRQLAKQSGLGSLTSSSDTEVVLELFAKIGVEACNLLNGMFAFAVYDTRARKLWLVRDRLGIKPLFYYVDATRLVFASEIKGMRQFIPAVPTCDMAGLHQWLYYGNPLAGNTLYAGIKQLLPGHYLELDLNSFEYSVGSYWNLRQQENDTDGTPCTARSAINETRRLLEQAVSRQLISDVPVGVFLSGGVDSSAIVAFASRRYAGRLSTYSAGFDFSPDGGELPKARSLAADCGTDHHELHIEGVGVRDLVEKMVYQHDMPFSDAANIPLYLMASEIKGQTKVVLQGDGGDELFGGYRRYSTLHHYFWLRFIAKAALPFFRFEFQSPYYYRARRYVQALSAADLATTMALLLTHEDRLSRPTAVFSRAVRSALLESDPFSRYRDCQQMFRGLDTGDQMSLVDLMVVLPDTYLEKVDRATMAASVEVRVPFLDHDLVDFVTRLPRRKKIPWGRKKWLLKEALRGIVPDHVLSRPKSGLTVPYGKWLQGPLRSLFFDHLSKFENQTPGVLDVAQIRKLYERTKQGQQNHSPLLWKLLNFMVWVNTCKVTFR